MKYRVHIESWLGGVNTREFEIYKGNGLNGDQPGVSEAVKTLRMLFPESEGNILNIQVDPKGDGDWWDIDKYGKALTAP